MARSELFIIRLQAEMAEVGLNYDEFPKPSHRQKSVNSFTEDEN